MKNIFEKPVSDEIIQRIQALKTDSQPLWGEMSVAQMLAHCCVAYELVYDNKSAKPKGFKKWMLKTFVKNIVVSEKPYKKNSRTAPEFLIADARDFRHEKERLIGFINQTRELGADYFDGLESHSFGSLNSQQWNNMFYKHLDHHLKQFGV